MGATMQNQIDLIILSNLNNQQLIRTRDGIAHILSSHYMFENCKINKTNISLIYNNQKFYITISEPIQNIQEQIFIQISVSSELDDAEPAFEKPEKVINIIIDMLDKYFDEIYITRHDISKILCIESYKYIHKAENTLREFIMKFMLSKIGSDWWVNNITDSNIKKANERKSDSFNPRINENIYNIDFKDLSEVIFNNHSQFKTKTAVLDALKNCNTFEDFQAVKENAISNWDKYFSDLFDNNWNTKWKDLGEYRNRIAHNKIINTTMYNNIQRLSNELVDSISKAYDKINEFTYSSEEIHVIKGEILETKSLMVSAALRKLKESGHNLDDVYTAIHDSLDNEMITSADVVKILQNGRYYTNESINRTIGVLLSSYSDKLNIEPVGESISVEDNNGDKTSCRLYKKHQQVNI